MPLIAAPEDAKRTAARYLADNRRHPERMLVALCPGCKRPANQWPAERFVRLAEAMVRTESVEAILLGGPAEAAMGNEIASAVPGVINGCGRFSFSEVAALFEHCALTIGLDTGTTHLAAAVGAHCIGIYGGRNLPGQWEPMGEGHKILRHPVPCEGCALEECPVEGHPCMTGISVEDVFAQVQQAISLQTQ
jgi:ADP-heptose:LPS heptosyltransferase